ncbi:MAG: DoxX family protein [Nocardioides sp.]|uniref:DoxX family protein n=1 Tax=Nocardioides sp. TaxID=35761 RepID=UPI003D6C4E8D
MAPLMVLVVVSVVLRVAGARGLISVPTWGHALRGGLAAMFLMTGTAHFVGMREQMIAMVPPSLPEPGVLVTVTGVLEILGAIGLLVRRTTRVAAIALALMLIGMFPANVYAATHGLGTEWLDNLVPRTVLQIVFLAATVIVARRFSTREDRAETPLSRVEEKRG